LQNNGKWLVFYRTGWISLVANVEAELKQAQQLFQDMAIPKRI
jgi:hypothetical protein